MTAYILVVGDVRDQQARNVKLSLQDTIDRRAILVHTEESEEVRAALLSGQSFTARLIGKNTSTHVDTHEVRGLIVDDAASANDEGVVNALKTIGQFELLEVRFAVARGGRLRRL